MDQGDSVVIAHISFDFYVFIFVKLSNSYILLRMLDALACLLFFKFLFLIDFPDDTSSVSVFVYVNGLIKCFNVNVSFLFVDKRTQFGLDRLRDLWLPLFLPAKQLLFEPLLVHLVLLRLVHPLQVLVKPLFLVFLMDGCLEFAKCRIRWLKLMKNVLGLD